MNGYTLLLIVVTSCLAGSAHGGARLCNKLTAALSERSSTLYTVIVAMKDHHEESMRMLDTIEDRAFTDRNHRIHTVSTLLRENAAASQNQLLGELADMPQTRSGENVEAESLWASNQMIIKNADVNLIEKLSQRDDVDRIEAEYSIKILDERVETSETPNLKGANDQIQWGVQDVNAPSVWRYKNNRGEGSRVGVIDTGVLESHEALAQNYVGGQNYGWYDPSTTASRTPTDVQGHGTHCTGSIVGTTRGVGVAPAAKWMACRGCGKDSCESTHLARCGQFMACPHNPEKTREDCTKAPHIVSNSWGGFSLRGNDTSYDPIIKSWRSLGIIPVFAIGNSGPFCHTAGSPGSSPRVIGVGATARNNTMAYFSSRGPTILDQIVKPDVSAPGDKIYSSSKKGTNQYEEMSGTSMACPHTAGVVALMLASQPNRNVTYDQVFKALTGSAVRTRMGLVMPNCLLAPSADNGRKTVQDGYGRIQADKAIDALSAQFSVKK